MLFSGYKWVVFKDEITKFLKEDINIRYPDNDKVYLQDREQGILVGEANIYLISSLLYNEENIGGIYSKEGIHLALARSTAVKEIYYEWCARKGLKPNPKEGWFKSKKFSSYLKNIEWGGNYAIMLYDIERYDLAR